MQPLLKFRLPAQQVGRQLNLQPGHCRRMLDAICCRRLGLLLEVTDGGEQGPEYRDKEVYFLFGVSFCCSLKVTYPCSGQVRFSAAALAYFLSLLMTGSSDLNGGTGK